MTRFPSYSIYIRKIFYAACSISISAEVESQDADPYSAKQNRGVRILVTSSLKSYFMQTGSRLLFPDSHIESASLPKPYVSIFSSILVCMVLVALFFCDLTYHALKKISGLSAGTASRTEAVKLAFVSGLVCCLLFLLVVLLNKRSGDEILQLENELLSILAQETQKNIIAQLKF